MASETSRVGSSDPTSSSCLQKVMKSKWTDVALITGFAALLVIGILASSGVFNFTGTTNAAYLSYGMYAGAVLFLIAEIAKVAINRCKNTAPDQSTNTDPRRRINTKNNVKLDSNKSINDQITKIEFGTTWMECMPPRGDCTITFANGQTAKAGVDGVDAYVLIQAVDPNKCVYQGTARQVTIDDFKGCQPDRWGNRTVQQVLDGFVKRQK